jgi:type II secretory pathway pseudopilin PulG
MHKITLPFPNLAPVRSESGDSLIGLLVATTIMSLVAAGLFGLMSLNVSESAKIFSRTDNINAARVAMDKMGRLVRQARSVGDVQGATLPTSNPFVNFPSGASTDTFAVKGSNISVAQVESGTAVNRSAAFPSTGDPFYGPNGSDNGNTAWPWGGSPTNPYRLAGDTLVIQVPTFDANGYPNSVVSGQRLAALDTYVFKVVQDTTRDGPTRWFQLQMAAFPASDSGGVRRSNVSTNIAAGVPVTLLSGIIGPLDAQGNPVVFQYIKSSDNSTTSSFPAGSVAENDLVLYNGVVVNFQIMTLGASSAHKATINSLRSELYLRNNSTAQIMGPSA